VTEVCSDAGLFVEQERRDPGLDEVHHVLLGHSHALQCLSRVTFGQSAGSVLKLIKELVSLLGLLVCDRCSRQEFLIGSKTTHSKTEDHKGKRGRTERGRRRDLNEFIEV